MPAQWPQGMIPGWTSPRDLLFISHYLHVFFVSMEKPKGRCLFCAAVEGDESQAAAPRPSLRDQWGHSWHGAGVPAPCLAAPGTRTGSGGRQPWLGWIPPIPDLVVALCQGPCQPPWAEAGCCAEMEPASVRAARVGGRRHGGRAVHMALPDPIPQG